jgi:tetratricopeptide (TPR) repeat protein
MQKKGDWAGIGTMFEEFAKEHPDDPLIPMAMYWIGRAKAKVGKADEAKVFVADTIKRYIDDPRRDAVEQLLTQLAQLCVRKRQQPDGAAPVPDSAAELNSLLGAAGERSPAAKARILYAQSELARLRKNTDEQAAKIDEIARNFAPEDLSPYLLALSGDHLLGLGEIALQNKDSARALELFDEAVDKGVAGQKLKEITIGRARALLALGRLDEAQKSFEQVASVREWRGDATAQAVFSLGEIEFQRGKWAEANVLYQRVFVAYQKFLPWVAKSYVRSMECFEKLGMKPEAIRTGREMLRNEKLTAFPESATARDHLKTLEGTPS